MHWRLVGRFYTSAGREKLRRLPEQWHRCEFLLEIMVGWIAFLGALIRNLPIVPIHFPFPCLKCWKKNLHSDWFHWQGNSPLLWRWLCFANAILQTSAWFQLNQYPTQAGVVEGAYENHPWSCDWCPYQHHSPFERVRQSDQDKTQTAHCINDIASLQDHPYPSIALRSRCLNPCSKETQNCQCFVAWLDGASDLPAVKVKYILLVEVLNCLRTLRSVWSPILVLGSWMT